MSPTFETDKPIRVSTHVIAWVLSMILGGTVVYAATQSRIAVLEEQIRQLRADVIDIRNDVKSLLSRGGR